MTDLAFSLSYSQIDIDGQVMVTFLLTLTIFFESRFAHERKFVKLLFLGTTVIKSYFGEVIKSSTQHSSSEASFIKTLV